MLMAVCLRKEVIFALAVLCLALNYRIALAQPNAEQAEAASALRIITADELANLPTPAKYNPSYWSFPDYAKTPFRCLGDDVIGNYVGDRFPSRKGTLAYHVISQGFISVSLPPADENAFDIVTLSSSERDYLRTVLKLRIQKMDETQTGRKWVFRIAGLPSFIS
jgi:hypothetical protein